MSSTFIQTNTSGYSKSWTNTVWESFYNEEATGDIVSITRDSAHANSVFDKDSLQQDPSALSLFGLSVQIVIIIAYVTAEHYWKLCCPKVIHHYTVIQLLQFHF